MAVLARRPTVWLSLLTLLLGSVVLGARSANAGTGAETTTTTPPTTASTSRPETTTSTAPPTSSIGVPGRGPPVEDLRPPRPRTAPPPVPTGVSGRRGLALTGPSTESQLAAAAILVCLGAALVMAAYTRRPEPRRPR